MFVSIAAAEDESLRKKFLQQAEEIKEKPFKEKAILNSLKARWRPRDSAIDAARRFIPRFSFA
jgi:hypothetical protein